jgi:calcineurin-like phosphoesterase family protein
MEIVDKIIKSFGDEKIDERKIDFTPKESSTQRMNDYIIDSCNHLVKPEDNFVICGDLIFGSSDVYEQRVKDFKDKINCKNIILIKGNHDQESISKYFKTYDILRAFVRDDEFLLEEPKKSHKYQKIVFCHYPILSWQGMNNNTWHIHGHSHGNSNKLTSEILGRYPIIDVGVDSIFELMGDYRPVNTNDLRSYFEKRKTV